MQEPERKIPGGPEGGEWSSPPPGAPPPMPVSFPSPPPVVPAGRRRRPGRVKALDFGRVFTLTFSTFFRNLHRLIAISLGTFAPILIAGGLYYSFDVPGRSTKSFTMLILALDLLVLHHLLTAAVVSGTNQALSSGRMSIGGAVRAAFVRAASVVGLGVIALAGISIGFALLVAPGVILACVWCAAFPAMMQEKIGPLAALRRSAALSKGNRLVVFAVLIVLLMALYALSSLAMLPLMLIFMGGGGEATMFIVLQCGLLLLRALFAVLSAVIYHELRVSGEGLEIKELESVFE
jgi:hypothetical protein